MTGDSTEVTPTADMYAQQEVNQKLWDYYKTSYKPVIDQYAAKVTDKGVQKQVAGKVAGQVNAEVMKGVTTKNMSSNPVANAKRLSGVAGLETAEQQSAAGKVASKQTADTQNIIDIGRGQATKASADLGTLAESSIQEEIKSKELDIQEQAATGNMIGSIAGSVAGVGYGAMKGGKKLKDPASDEAIMNDPTLNKMQLAYDLW